MGELAELLEQLEQLAQLLSMIEFGKVSLLVLQASPFCNINCSYCYLPDRFNQARMSQRTVEKALELALDIGVHYDKLSLIWHAGEPMSVPLVWYSEAFDRIETLRPNNIEIVHHFQTNATLVNDSWCEFFRDRGVQVGVSIDGPAELHDYYRRTRRGSGTHQRAMAGIAKMRSYGLQPHAICVLTGKSLHYPDVLFDFFIDNDFDAVGFNVEEIEGAHTNSSLNGLDAAIAFHHFVDRIIERAMTSKKIRVREIDQIIHMLKSPTFGNRSRNSENTPLAILSVSHDGAISTFSPELVGSHHPRYGPFSFGNVHADSAATLKQNTRLAVLCSEIARGVCKCRATCRHFDFCFGGAPSNKFFEHGRIDVAETMYCRLSKKTWTDGVLAFLSYATSQ